MPLPRSRTVPAVRGACGLFLLLLAACASPGGPEPAGVPLDCVVEAGPDPAQAASLQEWSRVDLEQLARRLNRPRPKKAARILCGKGPGLEGRLAVSRGETGRHVPGRGAGACTIYLAAERDPRELRSTLRHELVHHLLEGEGLPPWLEEGLAELLARPPGAEPTPADRLQDWHASLAVAGWRHGRPWTLPNLPELLRLDYRGYQEQVERALRGGPPSFHAVARRLAEVLWAAGGMETVDAYAARVRRGADPWRSFLEEVGLPNRAAVLEALGWGRG